MAEDQKERPQRTKKERERERAPRVYEAMSKISLYLTKRNNLRLFARRGSKWMDRNWFKWFIEAGKGLFDYAIWLISI